MNISILGTGTVGQTFAARLIGLGHQVMMGTRNVTDTMARTATDNYGSLPFAEWHAQNKQVQLATFAESAAYGDIIIIALQGAITLATLEAIGADNIGSKIIMDISNPLDFSKGFPPSLLDGLNNTHSLGEAIQAAFPNAKVVKTLNTMYCGLMVNPRALPEDTSTFLSGNNEEAKASVKEILHSFGWKETEILDLGDITTARGTESLLPIWLRIYGATKNGFFNLKIVAGK